MKKTIISFLKCAAICAAFTQNVFSDNCPVGDIINDDIASFLGTNISQLKNLNLGDRSLYDYGKKVIKKLQLEQSIKENNNTYTVLARDTRNFSAKIKESTLNNKIIEEYYSAVNGKTIIDILDNSISMTETKDGRTFKGKECSRPEEMYERVQKSLELRSSANRPVEIRFLDEVCSGGLLILEAGFDVNTATRALQALMMMENWGHSTPLVKNVTILNKRENLLVTIYTDGEDDDHQNWISNFSAAMKVSKLKNNFFTTCLVTQAQDIVNKWNKLDNTLPNDIKNFFQVIDDYPSQKEMMLKMQGKGFVFSETLYNLLPVLSNHSYINNLDAGLLMTKDQYNTIFKKTIYVNGSSKDGYSHYYNNHPSIVQRNRAIVAFILAPPAICAADVFLNDGEVTNELTKFINFDQASGLGEYFKELYESRKAQANGFYGPAELFVRSSYDLGGWFMTQPAEYQIFLGGFLLASLYYHEMILAPISYPLQAFVWGFGAKLGRNAATYVSVPLAAIVLSTIPYLMMQYNSFNTSYPYLPE